MPFSFNPQEDTYTVDPNSLSLTFAPPDQRREDPGWLETMTAAWERHNLIWNIGAMITQPTFGDEAGYSPFRRIDPDLPYNEQTNPWGEIAGYEMFANRFTGSRSTQETAYIRAKIDKEMRNIDILERGGAFGILASILAGSLDPLVVIPPIKAVRGVKLGATVLRQGGKATLQNAGIIAGQEMGLQIAQETRSIEESAAAITIGAIFTGALVGIGGGMSRSVRLKAAKHIDDVDQAMTAQAKQADAGKGDVLAHSDSPDALRTQPLKAGDEANGKSLAGIYEKEAAGATPDAARGVVARYGARWMARHAILRSSVESVRRFAHQSVLSPWVVKGSKVVHDRIEALKYGWHGKVVASMAKIQGLHKNLVRKVEGGDVDIQKLNIIDATIGNRAGKDQMSMPKFYEWVMKVMRRTPEEVAELKRAHGLPEEIFVAVDIVRKEVFDPLFGWGVRVGIFTKEQKNISYLTRMYNRELFRDKGQRHAFITALSTYWQKLPSDAGHLSLKRANKRAAEVARVIMRDPDEGMGAALLSQPLRERTLDVPDSVIEKWLVSDLEYIVRTYAKSMVGDLALIERFGRAQIMRVVGASRENFLNAAGELQKLQAKIKQAKEAGPGFGPTYYRGSKKGDKRRIQTGEEEFDSYLFVTDTRKGAEAYGPDVQEVTFKPGARILREGTKEFVRIAGRHRKGESLLDFSARATRLAKEDGYDAVHFKRQTDVGTAIMNPDAVVRGGMRARSAFANKQVAKQLKAAEKAFDVRLAAAKKDLVAGFTPAAGLGGDSWKRAVDAAFSTQNLRNWAAEVEPKTADLFDDAAKKLMDDWGGGDLRLLMDEVSSDLGKQIKTAEAAGNVKLRQKLMTERNRTLGFIEDTRNFLRGTHGIGADPTAMTPRVLSAVRQWNYMTVGGFIPVASLPDLGLVIMQTGMRRAFGSALSVWSSALRKESNLAKIDIHRLLGGSEVLTNARATEMFILEESHMALNKGERGLHRVSHAYSVGTGLAHYNQMMKDIVGMGTVQMIMENADEFVKRGKFLSGADELRLRDWGVDENFLRRVHGEWSNKAHVMDGKRSTRAINVDAWDQEIADSVRNVVFTSQKLSILSGGPLDLPKLGRDIRAVGVGRQTSASGRAAAAGAARSRATADAWAQTIFQFYNFGFAATSRILSRSVEIADMRVLQGVSASMALGAFSVMLRAKLNDKEIPEVGSLIAQSIDQAGLLGIFMDIGRPIEQAFQGEIGLSAVLEPFGLELRGSRYITSQTMLETLIGSSAGIPIAAVKTAFGILDGDMSDKDKRNFLRMIPAANMWYIRGLMNNLNGDEFDPIDYDDFFGADK